MRGAVDVVVPHAGDQVSLHAGLALRDGDTLVVERDPARTGSYATRNRGAARGSAPWILFLDDDVEAPADLLDRLFAPAPGERTGVLAGGVRVAGGDSAAARFAAARGLIEQRTTAARERWAFAQTACCAVRREAFEAAGGFREVRSGGDADLCWRLAAAGWALERRDEAVVLHRPRESVPALLRQLARHGSGAAWLEREHPGAAPRRRWPGLALWSTRRALAGGRALARGQRDEAVVALLDGPATWAFELGRLSGAGGFRARGARRSAPGRG